MRVLFGLFCLFSCLRSEGITEELETARLERIERFRAVLAEIAPNDSPAAAPPHDLPDAVREVIETMTKA